MVNDDKRAQAFVAWHQETVEDLLGRLSRSDPDREGARPEDRPTSATRWIGAKGSTVEAGGPAPTPSSRVRRLTSSEVDALVAAYLDGERIEDLASLYGIHRSTVMAKLRRAGVPRYSGWTEDTTKEARDLYEAGHSITEISERTGRARTTIGNHLRAAGVEMRPKGFR